MTEDFWMNLQLRWDLYKARQAEAKQLKAIRPFRFSSKSFIRDHSANDHISPEAFETKLVA